MENVWQKKFLDIKSNSHYDLCLNSLFGIGMIFFSGSRGSEQVHGRLCIQSRGSGQVSTESAQSSNAGKYF